jgi:hypothetical protein
MEMTTETKAFLENTGLISYNSKEFSRISFQSLEEIRITPTSDKVHWINTYGMEYREMVKNVIRSNKLDDFLLKLINDDEHRNIFFLFHPNVPLLRPLF